MLELQIFLGYRNASTKNTLLPPKGKIRFKILKCWAYVAERKIEILCEKINQITIANGVDNTAIANGVDNTVKNDNGQQ